MADFVKGVIVGAATGLPPYFSDGICDCGQDTGVCCQTLCCTFCTLSNIQTKRDLGLPVCDCCNFFLLMIYAYATGPDSLGSFSFAMRRELIQRYGLLEESTCKSCCLATCCWPCSICQVQREMGKRGEHCGGCCANAPANLVAPSVAHMALGAAGAIMHGGSAARLWTSGLCNCAGCADCCEGLFCPCVVVGYMANKLDTGRMLIKPPGTPNQIEPFSCLGQLIAPTMFVYANRREIIQRYNIIGESHNMTCIYAYCCTCCAMLQQRREMGYSNEWPGSLCMPAAPPRA